MPHTNARTTSRPAPDTAPDTAVRDTGAAAVLVVTVTAAVTALVLPALATFGRDLVDAARARTAADAAALASAHGDRGAAADLAAAHGGQVVRWWREGADVVVEVRVGAAVASARATTSP